MRLTLQPCARATSSAAAEKARKRPSSALPGTFSPSQRGEGTSMRFHQGAALHSCDSASLPSPRRNGEKGQACVFTRVQLAFLRQRQPSFAPRSGEKGQACANSCLHRCIPMHFWSLLRCLGFGSFAKSQPSKFGTTEAGVVQHVCGAACSPARGVREIPASWFLNARARALPAASMSPRSAGGRRRGGAGCAVRRGRAIRRRGCGRSRVSVPSSGRSVAVRRG